MPARSAADVSVQLTRLPYRTDFSYAVTWLGHREPTEDERESLRYLPQNYNGFPQIDAPVAFDCTNCKAHYPEMASRITTLVHELWDENAYQNARIVEREMAEKLQLCAVDPTRLTPKGRQSLPWARRYAALLKQADESMQERRRLGEVQNTEEHLCMECHYAQILPAR